LEYSKDESCEPEVLIKLIDQAINKNSGLVAKAVTIKILQEIIESLITANTPKLDIQRGFDRTVEE
jgi:hypothetical protein